MDVALLEGFHHRPCYFNWGHLYLSQSLQYNSSPSLPLSSNCQDLLLILSFPAVSFPPNATFFPSPIHLHRSDSDPQAANDGNMKHRAEKKTLGIYRSIMIKQLAHPGRGDDKVVVKRKRV